MQSVAHPPIPMAGYRGASHFGEIAELGLFFITDLTALIYVDVATRFSFISKVGNREPDTVRGDLLSAWVKRHRLPEQIATDSGGEFPTYWYADQCADAGTRLALEPKGSDAALAESSPIPQKAFTNASGKNFRTCRMISYSSRPNVSSRPRMDFFGRPPPRYHLSVP